MAVIQSPVRVCPERGLSHVPDLNISYGIACETVQELEYDASRIGNSAFIGRLNARIKRDRQTGIRYAILDGEKPSEVSEEEVIAFPMSFGMTLQSTAVMADCIRRAANNAGLRDQYGLKLPLVMFSSPVGDASVNLPASALEQVSKGNLASMAAANLELLQRLSSKKLGSLAIAGYSLGGAMAAATGLIAPEYGLEVTSMTIGGPGNAVLRTGRNLFSCFAQEARYTGAYRDNRPQVFRESAPDYGSCRAWQKIFEQRRLNMALLSGLAAGRFSDDLEGAIQNNGMPPTSIIVGTADLITSPPGVSIDQRFERLSGPQTIVRELDGERHGWGHNPYLIGTFAADTFLADAAHRR